VRSTFIHLVDSRNRQARCCDGAGRSPGANKREP
jgi:hypothetical protein